MIIDCRLRPPYKSFTHLHIYEPVCNKTLPRRIDAWDTPSANERSMELFLRELDEAGISKGVVMARAAANYANAVPNEEIQELIKEYADRFIGFGGIDLSAGIDAALKEVDACADYRFKAICLEPGFCDPPRKADDPVFYPIYRRCQELGLPVVMTLSFWVGPDIEYSNPAAVQRVANDFPLLRIVVAHACYPWWPHIFGAMLACPNIWIMPDLYMIEHYAPANQMCGDAVRWLDGERILYGSAYPCCDVRQGVEEMKRFHFSERLWNKIMHENAEKLFHL